MSEKPFGLRDLKVQLFTAGTPTDIPVAAKFGFKDTPAGTVELRGDDEVAAVHTTTGKPVVELEAGGIDLAVWAIITGGTYATGSGYRRVAVAGENERPYLVLGAKVQDNNGTGDVHVYLPKCKCTDGPAGEFRDGQFYMTGCTLEGIDDGTNGMYIIRANDTAADLNLTTFA